MITEGNFLDFKCPYCDETVSFPETSVGFVQECPNCLESLIVPEAGQEAGRPLPLPLTTQRLKLRRFAVSDLDSLQAWVADEERFDYVEGMPTGGEEEVLRWLERDGQLRLTTPNEIFHLAMELQEGNKLVGYLGLWFTDAQRRQVMFNISVHPDHRGQGFALEAVDALLEFCFEGIHLHRIAARCLGQNAPAVRLFESVGMRREAEFVKDHLLPEGGWANSVWYGAVDEDYRGENPGAK